MCPLLFAYVSTHSWFLSNERNPWLTTISLSSFLLS
uniref:Uncharacterized protein n=1 Tax=Anguilla anguilla TaxID=7936 RepID=A0A0E9XPK6_ANGAN